jgi:DNA-binding CsgD family transcriptional regulator
MLSMRGWIAFERGALADARADLEAVLEFGSDVVPSVTTAMSATMLAAVVAELGELDRAGELLAVHGLTGELPEHQVMNLALQFRSRVRAAQGRTGEALEDAFAVGRRYERLGLRRAVPPWRSQAAILLGDSGEARALVQEELRLAERWGTPLARGLALRGLGLVTGDPDALAAAVDALESSPHRLELARVRVDHGATLRRAGRRAEARESLRLGMDGAHACGARPLAERARTELLATGARPRRLALAGRDALTPSERRIAALAADGLTNRQIAQALFVTTATVETHLRHAFRKLGVGSRAELAEHLSG